MTFFHHAEQWIWLLSMILVPACYLVLLVIGIKLAQATKIRAFVLIASGFGLLMIQPVSH